MKILLISGHKPNDRYAKSTKTYEGQLNIEVVHLMASVLKQYCDCDYYPTDRDYYKDNKANVVHPKYDMSNFDYVFEVHFNSYDTRARGSSVQLHNQYNKGISVEKAVCKSLGKFFKLRGDGGIVRRNDLLNMNTALRKRVDYALVEVCFHDNPEDYAIYKANKFAIADGMATAIVWAFGLKERGVFKTVVGCSFLNLRKTPNGKIISEMGAGERVEFLGLEPDSDGDMWCKVRRELDGDVGYAWGDYLI